MRKVTNLVGQQFGEWTVLEDTGEITSDRDRYWLCQCSCGTVKKVRGSSLRKGTSKSCGCLKVKSLSQRTNLVGKRFDRLVVLKRADEQEYGQIQWLCQCDCGNQCIKTTTALHREGIHSCGCYNKEQASQLNKKDLVGQTFGLLTVIEELPERKNNCVVWLCQCKCGNIIKVATNSLTSGNTSSCGCINYSIGEANISKILKDNNIKFKSQYTEPSLKMKRFDFAILDDENNVIRLIEFDGQQHFNDMHGMWNSTETLEEIQKRDKMKNEWAKMHNIPLVRIPYTQRDKITLDMIMSDRYCV